MTTRIAIKNMVCPRCVEVVRQIFQNLGLVIIDIKLGSIVISTNISSHQKQQLSSSLHQKGFELLDDKHSQLINEIKSIIIQEVHHQKESSLINISTLLSNKLHYNYTYLSRLFSTVEGQTIERFLLAQKIEKVKELLTYDQLTLSEISFQMNYSSSAHLSAQFKKITGMTPTSFKQLHQEERTSLDML